VVARGKRIQMCWGARVAVANWTRATTRVPSHRTTPPPPLRVGGLARKLLVRACLWAGQSLPVSLVDACTMDLLYALLLLSQALLAPHYLVHGLLIRDVFEVREDVQPLLERE
jgi:hypothetical protein